MKRARGSFRALIAASALLLAQAASAQAFSEVETKYMRLFYIDPFQTYLVGHAGRCFQNSLTFEHELLHYTPSRPITVWLRDFSDVGNASASGLANFLAVDLSPFSITYETVSPNERINWVMNHELVHIATVDQANKTDRRARAFFGGKVIPNSDDPESIFYYYLTTPRDAVPRWLHEGIAVFIETWMAGGQGRGLGAYDEMVFRSKVRDDTRFFDPLSVMAEGTKIDFQVEVNLYLYGARFMTYLAYRYSPEELIRWISRPDGSKAYYTKNFKAVFGITLDQAWSEWVAFEKEFQAGNLAAIRKYPTTPYRDVAARPMGSVSRAFLDPGGRKVYVAFDQPGLVAHVGSISLDDGHVTPIVEVKQPVFFSVTSLAFDPESHTLFYTTDHTEERDLRSLDPATGDTKLLLKNARIGELAFDRADRSLWGVRHYNGIATLVRIPYPYKEWNQIRSWPYGETLYDLDVSKDGTLLSMSIGAIDGLYKENVFKIEDVLAGRFEPVAKFDFGTFIPSGFTFTDDGRYLYGSSYYTGVSNIFRYELATGKTEALSNAETGFFRPIPLSDGSLFVFRYSGEGFVPATIEGKSLEDISPITFLGNDLVNKHPVLKGWNVGSPSKVPFDDLVTARGRYHPFKSMHLESWFPILEGYEAILQPASTTTPPQSKTAIAAGFRLNFVDDLQFTRLSLNASYSPDKDLSEDERLHLRLVFKRLAWTVDAKYNAGDFYDLFGPTKTSRKGYSLRTAWDKTLIYDSPRKLTLTVDGAVYRNLEVLPYYQNVESPSDKLATAFVRLHYENLRSSLGSVEAEKGQMSDLYVSANYANPDLVPQILGTYDFGFQLPLTHSSIWLRNAVGAGFGARDDAFAQFFFGGFGNNYVDHRETRRYRQFYAFPGLELNEVGGRTFAKSILDWNLPPIYFRHVGTPGFFANWARTSIFVAGLSTDFDGKAVKQTLGDAGAQMDIRFTTLSRLSLTLSFGYAAAFQSGFGPRHEGMISLKVLQ
jgi:hypothetical protein